MYYLLRWILENLLRRKFAESVPPHRELFQLIESFNFLTPCREAVKYMKLIEIVWFLNRRLKDFHPSKVRKIA